MSVDAQHLNTFHPSDPETPSEADIAYVRDRYLENVDYADSLVGEVLGLLERHGGYDDALVILTSDHGESFMEHGRFLHSQTVHHELLHVPLVVKWPRSVTGFRKEVAAPVSLLDLVPTLVDALDLEGAPDGFQGRSLLPLAFEGDALGERSFYAVTRGANGPNQAAMPVVMLESGGWRVHHTPLRDATELYDGTNDPLEENDLARERPLQALLLRQSLLIQAAWNRDLLRWEDTEGGDLDAEEIEQLEALGYLN
jgi:arylsulfatase A-like enzyme